MDKNEDLDTDNVYWMQADTVPTSFLWSHGGRPEVCGLSSSCGRRSPQGRGPKKDRLTALSMPRWTNTKTTYMHYHLKLYKEAPQETMHPGPVTVSWVSWSLLCQHRGLGVFHFCSPAGLPYLFRTESPVLFQSTQNKIQTPWHAYKPLPSSLSTPHH